MKRRAIQNVISDMRTYAIMSDVNTYAIWNMNVYECLGVFEGTTEDEALDAMARDAGFRDCNEMIDTYGLSREEAKSELEVRIVR